MKEYRMTYRASLAVVRSLAAAVLSLAATGGCTTDDLETVAAQQRLEDVPTPAAWDGRASPRDLFPAGVAHLHTFMTTADGGSFYAWGIASGEVLWIYQVPTSDAPGFLAALGQSWSEAETGAGISHSIAGAIKGPPPPPPVPTGVPRFSAAYVSHVLASAQHYEDATELELAGLAGL
jgi:hypothetical protein